MKFSEPIFEEKQHGSGAGIPVLKTLWESFDFSLVFSRSGIYKHAGAPAWEMVFGYICGMVSAAKSTNDLVHKNLEKPLLARVVS